MNPLKLRKTLTGVFLCLFPIIVCAQSIKIKDEKIFLEASDCQKLQKELDSIWKKTTTTPQCECPSRKCFADITQVLPVRIKDLVLKKYSGMDGPNCWNSVLYLNGMAPGLIYSEGEIEFWYNSPLCKVVSPGAPLPGDIVSYSRKGRAMHSFRYVSENLVFNKNNGEAKEPYELLEANGLLKRLRVKKQCQNVKPEEVLQRNCEGEYTIYRCESFEDFISTETTAESAEARKQLREVADCFTNKVLGKGDALSSQLKDVAIILNRLSVESLKLPKREDLPLEVIQELDRQFEVWDEQDLNYLVILSQSDMNISGQFGKNRKAVELLRKHNVYDHKPLKEFLMWSQVYLTSRRQIEELEYLQY